jgi:hypothetical protein
VSAAMLTLHQLTLLLIEFVSMTYAHFRFEVYATLMKNVVDANKELLNVQKQMRTMDGKESKGDTKIDKAIFVGSTAELNKLLKGKE